MKLLLKRVSVAFRKDEVTFVLFVYYCIPNTALFEKSLIPLGSPRQTFLLISMTVISRV